MFEILVIGAILLSSCSETKNDLGPKAESGGAPRLFLSPKDMSVPAGAAQISTAEIPNVINNDDSFFLKNPAKSVTQDNDECAAQLSDAIKVRATARELVIDGVATAKDCLPDKRNPSTKTLSTQVKVQVYMRCTDVDLSSFDGLSYAKFQDLSLRCGDGLSTYAIQYVSKQQITTTDFNIVADITLRATQFTPEGNPCPIQKLQNGGLLNGCVISKTSVASGVTATGAKASTLGNPRSLFPATFTQHTFKNAEFNRFDDRFFRSGSVEFKLNNWSGVMTYRDGGNPKWTASEGSANLNGDFNPPTRN